MSDHPTDSKQCNKCGLSGPVSLFLTDKDICKECNNRRRRQDYGRLSDGSKAEILERNRRWREANIEQARSRKREYERKNKDQSHARTARWRVENAAYVAEQKRLYYEANADLVKARVREWIRLNRAKRRAQGFKRRALKRNAPGASYTTWEHICQRWAMWGGKCWMCGKPAEATDHVIPLNDGGSHWPSNLRPICTSCNSKRPKRWPRKK